ncbi:MAG: DUF1801 domain-containing protein [Planctomycetes bacterium]|nr:DUF1801 domain-containing protein [Planctomycetota bacterium]
MDPAGSGAAGVGQVLKRSARSGTDGAAAAKIDARIAELGDWRGNLLARIHALILAIDQETVEEWKWRGTPVWSLHGIVCTGETYRDVVKMTFAKGASLPDPKRLFNASLDGNTRRAIDLREGDRLDEPALRALIQAAIAANVGGRSAAATPAVARSKQAGKGKRIDSP